MELNMTTATGKESSKSVSVSDDVFGREFNEALVHQVVTAYMAGGRAGTKAQKNRSDVSGGGKKPHSQKGSGRARAGTIRSPLWRSGGTTFAARPQDWTQKVNRKMYSGALKNILSELVRQDRLVVVDKFDVDAKKTKAMVDTLARLGLTNALIVTDELSENLYFSVRNIPHVDAVDVQGVNPVNLIKYEKVLMTSDAVKKIEEQLS